MDQLAAQLVEQRRRRDAAGAVDAVEHDLESLGGNPVHVDAVEDSLHVQRVRVAVLHHRHELLHAHKRAASFRIHLAKPVGLGRWEGHRVSIQIFQPVPLDRIMRRRRDQRRVGFEMPHHHRHAWRGHDVQIDDFDPAGRQRRDCRIAHPRAAGARVATEDHAESIARAAPRLCRLLQPDREGRRQLLHHRRGQRPADRPAHPRNPEHQCFQSGHTCGNYGFARARGNSV